MKTLFVTALVAAVVGASPSLALADPPACPPADGSCAALVDRLETIHADNLETQALIEASGGEPVSGTVALDDDASSRLDLIWWAGWALVGLGFVTIVAPRWFAAFRVTHGS